MSPALLGAGRAGHGRLPLWLEGRGASFATSIPYGLYQQLLSSWVGVTAEAGEEELRAAMERALQAVMGSTGHLAVLSRVMGLEAGAAIAKMSPEELRWETFAALRAVLTQLVGKGPTVLTLEDLHWADPTSLSLTQGLASVAAERPLLLLATARPGPQLSELEAGARHRPGTTSEASARTPDSRGRGRLGLAPAGWRGNRRGPGGTATRGQRQPAFPGRAFRVPRRDGLHRAKPRPLEHLWARPGRGTAGPRAPSRSRLDRLGPTGKDVARTASVLGERFPSRCSGRYARPTRISAPPWVSCATAAFCKKCPGRRNRLTAFATPLSRRRPTRASCGPSAASCTGGLPGPSKRLLLGGWRRSPPRSVATSPPPGEPERALHYFELAGDHAERAFASEESEACFLAALDVPDAYAPGDDQSSKAGSRLRGKLAKVLWRTGRRAEACELLREAIGLVRGRDDLEAAHLLTTLGLVEVDDYHYDAAQAVYEDAEALLGDHPLEKDPATVDQWLELMVKGWPAAPAPRKARAGQRSPRDRPPGRRVVWHPHPPEVLYHHRAWQRGLQRRWRVDDEMVADLNTAKAAAMETGDASEVAWAGQLLGAYLVLHGDIEDGRRELEASLATAERSGDLVLQAHNLARQAMAALRQRDVDGVRRLTPVALAAAEALRHHFTWEANVKGCLAWLAWQDERPDDVIALAAEAAELYQADPNPNFRWKWAYLLPLMAVHLREAAVAEAVAAAHELLGPSQYSLPDPVEAQLAAAVKRGSEDSPWQQSGHYTGP